MPVLALLLEHLALAVASVGGVLAARGRRIDLFGVVTLALVTALGGGTLREAALGVGPAPWVRDPTFLLTPSVVALGAFVLLGRARVPLPVFLVADALALALFTVGGVARGLSCGAHPTAAVALGVVTGVAGGVVRDTLLGEIPLIFRREAHFYATAALGGAAAYAMLHRAGGPGAASAVAIGVALSLRMASIRWNLALPDLEPQRASHSTSAQRAPESQRGLDAAEE